MKKPFFEIVFRSGMARAGKIYTSHGVIETPYLFPVATVASVRSLTSEEVEDLGAQAVLANTYHLMLRPGVEVIKKAGGLHKFMAWNKPIATDSGGFQVFSLGSGLEQGIGKFIPGTTTKNHKSSQNSQKPRLNRITEEGVEFRDHITGSKHLLTPEKSTQVQNILESDIRFAFDELTSPLDNKEYTVQSLARTHRWAARSLKTHKMLSDGSALFGILQGGPWQDLRSRAIREITGMDFDGIGIGGILGKTKQQVHQMVGWICQELDKVAPDKPRHLLGIGDIDDLVAGVKMGVDLFDVVLPTRLARRGVFYVKGSKADITSAKFKADLSPLDPSCSCPTCQHYSRAYLHHLYKGRELTAYHLLTTHNLYFVLRLMERLREAVKTGKIDKFKI